MSAISGVFVKRDGTNKNKKYVKTVAQLSHHIIVEERRLVVVDPPNSRIRVQLTVLLVFGILQEVVRLDWGKK